MPRITIKIKVKKKQQNSKSNISEKFEQRLWVSLELSSNCKNKGPAISGSPKQTTTAVHTHTNTHLHLQLHLLVHLTPCLGKRKGNGLRG